MKSKYSDTRYYRPAPSRDNLDKSDGRAAPILKPNVVIKVPRSFSAMLTVANVNDGLNRLPNPEHGKVNKFHLLRVALKGRDRVFEYTHTVEAFK